MKKKILAGLISLSLIGGTCTVDAARYFMLRASKLLTAITKKPVITYKLATPKFIMKFTGRVNRF